MQKFELELKNEKIKQYHLFALLIISLNVLFLVSMAVTNSEIRFRSIAFIVLITVFFIVEKYSKKKRYNAKGAATLLIIFAYLAFQLWWAATVMAFLAILYIISVRKLVVKVNTSYIIYPSVIKNVIEWKDLSNVLLKDGLLTIDFKSNKIIQQLIENTNETVDEKEFNDFCREQLKRQNSSPGSGDGGSYNGFTEMLNVIQ